MKTILIIEDNKSLREEVYEALKFEGYEVLQAESGKMGVKNAVMHHPDLILCDIMMPEMDGYEVLSRLREHEQAKLIPFIFITALADRSNIRTGMEMGADDYITKPFSIKELTNAINIRLEKYYNIQIGYAVDNIEKNLQSKLKSLKEQISIQKTYIAEISETNTRLTETLKDKETEMFEEVVKTVETSNTLHIFRTQLESELKNRAIPDSQKELLQELLHKIERIGSRKDNWRIFQLKFNQVYPDFIGRITRQYPKLTQLELTIISTILFNLNSNQIASMLNISPKVSVKAATGSRKSSSSKPVKAWLSLSTAFSLTGRGRL
ncbi:MAG: response regulator [Bacteroidales bacterium]|nr:response regulator [Bacteroidales bacterium]